MPAYYSTNVIILNGVRYVAVSEVYQYLSLSETSTATYSNQPVDCYQDVQPLLAPRRLRLRDILAALPATENPRKPPLERLASPPTWRGMRFGQQRKRSQHYG